MPLETRLIIGATDETTAAFASVMAKIERLQTQIAGVDRQMAAASAAIGAVGVGPSAATVAATAVVDERAIAAANAKASSAAASAGAGSFWDTVMGLFAVFTGYKAVHGGYQEAMAQQHERMRQEVAAMSPEEISKGEAMSAELAAKYPAVPESAIMHTLRTARTVTGAFEEATAPLEPLTQLRVIAQAAAPHMPAEEMEAQFDKLVKALEIAGVATQPAKLQAYIDDIAKSLNAFGDQLKPEDYFEMLKYGRGASPNISERFLMTTLATLGTEFDGANVGTALAGFNQAVIGNRFTHTAAMGFVDLGLIPDEQLARTKTGEIKGIKPGGHVKDWRLAQSDPDLWIKQDLLPALAAKGITDKDEIAARIGQLFSNRNAANLVTQIATQQAKLEKNASLWNQAQGRGAADVLASKDAETVFAGVGNSINRWVASKMDTNLGARSARGSTK
jgi:hypothetical protein